MLEIQKQSKCMIENDSPPSGGAGRTGCLGVGSCDRAISHSTPPCNDAQVFGAKSPLLMLFVFAMY